jgi:hypothetical protein
MLHTANVAVIPDVTDKAYLAFSKLAKFLLRANYVGFPNLA